MNYLQPQRLDALARDYALGTMTGGARRRFERLLRDHAPVRGAVVTWSGRLAHLANSIPPKPPSDAVWNSLQQRLFPGEASKAERQPWWRAWFGANTWRGAAGGVLAGLALALVVVRQQPEWLGVEAHQEALPQSYVGLLSNAQGVPAVLASSRRQGRQLSVKLLQPLAIPEGRVAQLWALPKDGAPFPVGVVPAGVAQGKSVLLPLTDSSEKLFFTVPRLAVSLEPAPAKAGDKPSAEFLLSGPCVKLW
ncbi:anti-sigma factor [Aquincola sp. S2]|uniref:Anti-sigma factor n=1 Tax=Pseudaquabacterium terrae TaxID=2732868 RepID=A0ABX2ENI4_9BURK|nr:anti-sigma factor [Aquabacterium terrae]NRF70232.1 anti-sigma factor [Aquabacterium terrae]